MKVYDMIRMAEEQFAREVTLGVIVQKPLKLWQSLIPGMFIIDFLRRGRAIRQYTKYYLFPRNLAFDAARSLGEGQDQAAVNSRTEEDVSTWLSSLDLNSPDLLQAQLAVVNLLTDHYLKILNTQGNSYALLIKDAYKNRESYLAYLDRLTAAEKEVDRKILEKWGRNEKLREKLLAEQQQVEKCRKKMLDQLF
ncbi:MAG: NF038143 family protein [Desulfobacterales bacterium]|jgi:hypothetical protein